MNLDSFRGPGSTPSRRRFWDRVTQAVNASQKIQGKNISVDEHQGIGTIINRPIAQSGIVCPDWSTVPNISITIDGVAACPGEAEIGCINDTFTLSNVDEPGNTWLVLACYNGIGDPLYIQFFCGDGTMIISIGLSPAGNDYFLTDPVPPSATASSIYTSDDCGVSSIGYGGTATWSVP